MKGSRWAIAWGQVEAVVLQAERGIFRGEEHALCFHGGGGHKDTSTCKDASNNALQVSEFYCM